MAGHIFNIQSDGRLTELNVAPFANEDLFQTLLQDYPNLLAGDQISSDEPRRWLLVRREMGVADTEAGGNRWSLDHLFLDQDAIPTLIEVKRGTDTRIRREVVGQMLDYAANAVVHWSIEQVIAEYERQCDDDGIDSEERLQAFLEDDREPEEYWQSVKTNLQAGKVRMLFVADEIPKELRRIVEFLNEQMDPAEVLAVEIKHYVGEGMKTLVPRVIGQTAEAESRKHVSSSANRRNVRSEEELQELANVRGVGNLYEEVINKIRPHFGRIATTRSNIAFKGKVYNDKSQIVIISVVPGESYGGDGLKIVVYPERIADFFHTEHTRVLHALPPGWEHVDTNYARRDRQETYYWGYIKSMSALSPLIELMESGINSA